MKRIGSLICALLLIFTGIPVWSVTAESTEAAPVQAIEAALPSSFSLVGTSACPPIDNQGSVGSCVSQTATYMQFTNAVARYMQSLGNTSWKPNNGSQYGDDRYIFSPKFTYNYGGAATIPVIEVLMTMGCATQNLSKFYKSGASSGYRSYRSGVGYVWENATTSWDVGTGVLQEALRYRLTGYEHYWTRNVADGQITTTTEGRKLLDTIKQAVVDGNVVLTGGISGQWSYGKITRKGSIAKAGENVIYGALSNGGGGHQVSIVGYDDNCEFDIGGVTLKGAFLVANSWGQTWGNSGYVWFMYDGINMNSQFASQCSALCSDNRTMSLDQFLITRWDENITTGYPELMVNVEVTTTDREQVQVELLRYDPASGETACYLPKLFEFSGLHDNYDNNGYFNYGGYVNGAADKAYFTFSYLPLIESIPAGKSKDDYVWGIRVKANEGYRALVENITLKNAALQTLYSGNPAKTVTDQAAFLCASDCYVLGGGDHYRVVPQPGYTNPVPTGGDFRFTLEVDAGFTAELAVVSANGKILRPAAGVYTITDVRELQTLSVVGIVEDLKDAPTSVGVYNWETFYGTPVLNITVPVSDMPREIYADVENSAYPYVFRLTDQDSGISYYVKAHSIYDFGNTILYRLPLQESGMKIEKDQNYRLTVEVCYGGRTLHKGSISSTAAISVTPASSPKYLTYTVNGSQYAKDAYLPGATVYLREVPKQDGLSGKWQGNAPAVMGNSDLTLTASYTDAKYTVSVAGDVCTVQPCAGSVYPVPEGDDLSFRLVAPEGYTTDLATVYCGGEKLTAVNGVYTLRDLRENLTLTVTGIVKDLNGAPMTVKMYNGAGWENYGGDYVMVISIPNSDLDPAIYADSATVNDYPYSFRLTDLDSGVSYYLYPQSFYYFSASTLYRLKIQPSGFTAVAGKAYNFKVELCYGGRGLYAGTMSTTCGYTSTVTPNATPSYVTYTMDGATYAKDAFIPGQTVVARELPKREGYIGSWTGDRLPLTMGSSNLQQIALYEKETYAITWMVNGEATVERYGYGELPTFKGTPSIPNAGRVGYRFIGWDKTVQPVDGAATYVAQFEEITAVYTVTWVVGSGTVTEEYEYGSTPTFKGSTEKPSTATTAYRFTGWNKALRAVTKDVTYTAQYEEILLVTYTVIWDVDGVQTAEQYPAGSTPVYPGSTPEKAATAEYTYYFVGWTNGSLAYFEDQPLPVVNGNITYTALFDGEKNRYDVTWVVEGTETVENYAYGQTPSYKGTPEKAEDEQYTYSFKGWSPEVGKVTGAVTYTAVFTATPKSETLVGDLNGDGVVSIQDVTVLLIGLAIGDAPDSYDINGDSVVSIQDVTALLLKL